MKKSYCIMLLVCNVIVSCGQKEEHLFDTGSGIVNYECGPDFNDRIVPIHYYIPEVEDSGYDMPVQIVMHGTGRNAADYLDFWKEKADKYKVAVFVPEFTKKDFPLEEYHLGNIADANGDFSPVEKRTYILIDRIFEFIKDNSGLEADKYNIFGHSAGGQFVHRFMLFHDSPYVNKGVSANSGWYTFPDESENFPYGIRDIPDSLKPDCSKFLKKNLVILLGTADTLITRDVRTTEEANRQGRNRFMRGKTFYGYGMKMADSLKTEFNWKTDTVEGVSHEGDKMSKAAADRLYGK